MESCHVVIIGAGLVGALAGISFARRGYKVSIFDARPDPRLEQNQQGRSINLAVSARGIGAIRSIDARLCDEIVQRSIPMKGRMIHIDGEQQSQLYGLFGECINSIDRSQLNINLLDEAEKYGCVSLEFNHKLLSINFEEQVALFQNCSVDSKTRSLSEKTHSFDLLVGCDGAFSVVRASMMRIQRMNFTQEYIEHAYLELSIPASTTGNPQLDQGHLHIWPRQEFMLIALPNPDNSFTSTFFAPFSLFESIKTPDDILAFFAKQFPDALELIGEARLLHVWEKNPISPLLQIRCAPYHYQDKAILLGDATHAMAPFYGQGMNCGFEDLRVLNEILDSHSVKASDTSGLSRALSTYSSTRHEDLLAILDLAMGNYIEMRSSVTSRLYLLKKRIDGIMGHLFQHRWVPMYSMVSFRDDIPYAQVMKRQAWQSKIVNGILLSSGVMCSVTALLLGILNSSGLRSSASRIFANAQRLISMPRRS